MKVLTSRAVRALLAILLFICAWPAGVLASAWLIYSSDSTFYGWLRIVGWLDIFGLMSYVGVEEMEFTAINSLVILWFPIAVYLAFRIYGWLKIIR
ncbi:hypothetical protein [Pseudacidovorax intermedius]|uniref:hypothetical protein n=1 Tax=Pseudacidovorax intermedius TaxID=433924 RepID=UPI0005C2A045|nr:hypothetical protein [Pseudacidovorax intermedius]